MYMAWANIGTDANYSRYWERVFMTPYLLTFTISFILCAIGEDWQRRENAYAVAWYGMAVFSVSILAGCRALTIGTDIYTYGRWLYAGALENPNLFTFIRDNAEIEVLYTAFTWIVARLFHSQHMVYLALALLIYGLVMSGFTRLRDYISVSIAWMSFLYLFYGDTLNALRQSVSVAIVIWIFPLLLERKYGQYILFTVIAYLFHNTAVFSLTILFVWLLLKWRNEIWVKLLLMAITVLAVVFYRQLLQVAMNLSIVQDKMSRYLAESSGGMSLNPMIVRLPYLILIALFYWSFVHHAPCAFKEIDYRHLADFLIMMVLLEIIAAETRNINVTFYRISLYYGMYRCIAIGRLERVLCRSNRKIVDIALMVLLLITWIYQVVIQNNNAIYPYSSDLLAWI